MIDTPTQIRKGEELPLQALQQYFTTQQLPTIINILQYPSGYSNLTYCIQTEEGDMVLRRAPFGASAQGGHNMEREFRLSEAIAQHYAKIPRPIHMCRDTNIIGSPFYLMQKMEGIIIRKDNASFDASFYKKLSYHTAEELAHIHNLPNIVLPDLGRPDGYVHRQITGWIARHEQAQTTEISGMKEINEWLVRNMPLEQGNAIIHNDYKYDNIILSSTDHSIVGILDWEMTTRGCPLMDLGASLGYWLESEDTPELRALPFCPTHLPGNLSRLEFIDTYAQIRGISIPKPSFYLVYGVWRLIIILEQIYKRYVIGHTKDPRFQALGQSFPLLIAHAMKLKREP